ncbi:GIDE domain-containing protein [Halostella pelagica]|uniref:GIDE domain-containing protein n=1 Tax=Halostella pelagica TaxID=2583824 RepID=UPI001080AA98|nr:GIDE domain-containing protein [Halostella pelagica]
MALLSAATALIAVLVLVSLLLLGDAGRHGARAYRVYRNDPIDVASAANVSGIVEIEGSVGIHESSLRAPFSGTKCVVCEYEVQELRSSGKNNHWETIHSGSGRVPFVLDDDTGALLVDPDGAALALDDHTTRVDGGKAPPERIRRWIEDTPDVGSEEKSWDLRVIEIATGDDRKYIERRLDPGDPVHVYGGVEYEPWSNAAGTVNAVVRDGETALFRITDGDEGEAVRRLAMPALWRIAGAAVVLAVLWVVVSPV